MNPTPEQYLKAAALQLYERPQGRNTALALQGVQAALHWLAQPAENPTEPEVA